MTETGGDPIAGARIEAVGTAAGVVTDRDGRYSGLSLEPDRVRLRVTHPGYRRQVRDVALEAGSNEVHFRLVPEPIELDRIVVTGVAGDVRRRAIGNTVGEIDAEAVLSRAPVTDFTELLIGRVEGVVVLPGSGTVGTGSSIHLRGLNSITQGQEPLVYVDGARVVEGIYTGTPRLGTGGQLPSRLNDLDPEEIESVEIVKGSAAAALYGTEAAAGVIHVVTKKGRPGETHWSVKTSLGRVDLGNHDYPSNFAVVPSEAEVPECVPITFGDRRVGAEDCGLRIVSRFEDGSVLIAQDAVDQIIDEGLLQAYDASVGGGTEPFTFFASGHLRDEKGPLPENDLKQVGGRANFRWSSGPRFGLTVSTGYTNNDYRLPVNDDNIFGSFSNALTGRPDRIRAGAGGNFAFGERFSPIDETDAIRHDFTNDRFIGSASADVQPVGWLSGRATLGLDVNVEENIELFPYEGVSRFPLGFRTNQRATHTNVTFDVDATARAGLGETWTSHTSLGWQVYDENADVVIANGENFPAPGVETVSAAGLTYGDEYRFETATVGGWVQEQLAWRDRLFLTGAVRFDDSSAFGPAFDFEAYPKASAAWVASEEDWFDVPLVSTLKLRAALGFAGRQPDAFASERVYLPVSVRGGEPAITPLREGAPFLGPERSREVELGFDASLWHDRLGLEVTHYAEVVEDALVWKTPVLSRGFPGAQLVNVAAIENRGWEVALDWLAVDTDSVDGILVVALATNDNEVTDLGSEEEVPLGPDQFAREGFPLAGFFDRVIVGRSEDGSPILSEEKAFLGRASPGFWGSIGGTLGLLDGAFEIHTLFEWKHDFAMFDGTRYYRLRSASSREAWDPAMRQSEEVRDLEAMLAEGVFTPFVEPADFISLREISLTFDLPRRWAARLGARRATASIGGRNLATWTGYGGLDPEVSYQPTPALLREEFLTVPQARRWIGTLSLGF